MVGTTGAAHGRTGGQIGSLARTQRALKTMPRVKVVGSARTLQTGNPQSDASTPAQVSLDTTQLASAARDITKATVTSLKFSPKSSKAATTAAAAAAGAMAAFMTALRTGSASAAHRTHTPQGTSRPSGPALRNPKRALALGQAMLKAQPAAKAGRTHTRSSSNGQSGNATPGREHDEGGPSNLSHSRGQATGLSHTGTSSTEISSKSSFGSRSKHTNDGSTTHASDGPISLSGNPRGTTVLVQPAAQYKQHTWEDVCRIG
jgi:hypothetical protein